MICVGDKLRFIDQTGTAFVHSVEVTTPDAPAHFFTLWVKASNNAAINAWVEDVGLDGNLHDPGLFHADDPDFLWVLNAFPNEHYGHYRTHYHVLCDGPVKSIYLEPFAGGMSAGLWSEIQASL